MAYRRPACWAAMPQATPHGPPPTMARSRTCSNDSIAPKLDSLDSFGGSSAGWPTGLRPWTATLGQALSMGHEVLAQKPDDGQGKEHHPEPALAAVHAVHLRIAL